MTSLYRPSLKSMTKTSTRVNVVKEEVTSLNTSIQNFNPYINISSVKNETIRPRLKWNREEPRTGNELKIRDTFKHKKKRLFTQPISTKTSKNVKGISIASNFVH